MLVEMRMTNTDFIVRDPSRANHPPYGPAEPRFRALDGVLILAFLAAFVGLVFLLSK